MLQSDAFQRYEGRPPHRANLSSHSLTLNMHRRRCDLQTALLESQRQRPKAMAKAVNDEEVAGRAPKQRQQANERSIERTNERILRLNDNDDNNDNDNDNDNDDSDERAKEGTKEGTKERRRQSQLNEGGRSFVRSFVVLSVLLLSVIHSSLGVWAGRGTRQLDDQTATTTTTTTTAARTNDTSTLSRH